MVLFPALFENNKTMRKVQNRNDSEAKCFGSNVDHIITTTVNKNKALRGDIQRKTRQMIQ